MELDPNSYRPAREVPAAVQRAHLAQAEQARRAGLPIAPALRAELRAATYTGSADVKAQARKLLGDR